MPDELLETLAVRMIVGEINPLFEVSEPPQPSLKRVM
jgi:hypothetical protein